jgi:hypothetical protein
MPRSHEARHQTSIRFDDASAEANLRTTSPHVLRQWERSGFPVERRRKAWVCRIPASLIAYRSFCQPAASSV